MGYDFHITRRTNWSDETGAAISASEWLSLVERDEELVLDPENGPNFATCRSGKPDEHWLDWANGGLVTKNPEKWFVSKMLDLAAELDARVVGDEGEEYTLETIDELLGDTATDQALLPYWIASPFLWFRGLFRHRWPKCPAPPFRVGDRVKDITGQEATVVKLQRTAEFGYGRVEVEFDNGHRSSTLFLDNTGLELLEPRDG